MKLYFGNAVTAATTIMIIAMLALSPILYLTEPKFSAGAEEACFCLYSDLSYAALRLQGTVLTKPFSIPLTEAAIPAYFR